MSFFIPSFHPKADKEMDLLLTSPPTEIIATQLLARLGWTIQNGLLPFEYPHTLAFPYSASPIYLRRKVGVLSVLTAFFTIVGPVRSGSMLVVLAVDTNAARGERRAKERT
ncbi:MULTISPECIES: hypothetical protein [Cupriavidus]|uniref:hypothetical protein n=1 Tax=Cupriavidus TaxID=106589 RepID=UPI00160233D5|nr:MULTISPECIES: hypothetical protein [Cupriavidus]MBB1629298.1 hypothetical protein [Cupriavidus sp. UME77]MCP3020562.1 hypothetical protein [Cupriavidus basilensis]MDR3382707.1 hypothetical protein [Cupriavidus basilensis]